MVKIGLRQPPSFFCTVSLIIDLRSIKARVYTIYIVGKEIQMAKLSNTIFGRNKVVVTFIMRFIGAYGGEVHSDSVYNKIHGVIAIYKMSGHV